MSKTRKVLLTVLVIGVVGALAGIGTFSAFSSTTVNSGNEFAAGTVFIEDNDAGSAMYNVSAQVPLASLQRCIRVTYRGTLPADVRLYTTSAINPLGDYIDFSVEKGTGVSDPFSGCTGFAAQSTIYNGELDDFATTHSSYASGVNHYPGAQTQWDLNDALYYRFTLTLQDDNNANGGLTPLTTGLHSFTWEARNQ